MYFFKQVLLHKLGFKKLCHTSPRFTRAFHRSSSDSRRSDFTPGVWFRDHSPFKHRFCLVLMCSGSGVLAGTSYFFFHFYNRAWVFAKSTRLAKFLAMNCDLCFGWWSKIRLEARASRRSWPVAGCCSDLIYYFFPTVFCLTFIQFKSFNKILYLKKF